MKTSLFFSPDRDITNAYKNFGAIGSVMRKVRGMSAPANCYRRARDGDTDAMIGWLKKRRNLTQKRFRKLNRMSDLRAMRFLNKHGIGNDLSERPPSTARKRAQSGFRRRARRHWNDLGAHFESTVQARNRTG